MNKTLTINKPVDLEKLQAELRIKAPVITGLSLDADTNLIIHNADDLSENDIQAVVAAHIKPVVVPMKEQLRQAIESENQLTPSVKALLKRIVTEMR